MSEAPFIKKPRRSIFKDTRADTRVAEELAMVTQLGFTMAGCIVFCFWVGLKLDRFFVAGGILLTIFILFGVIGGAWTVYRQIQDVYSAGERGKRDGGT